ncbi:unnamed protein product [Rotaria sordida]|uniref:UNC93-like protein n=1 Tax=Rotaria sordida TaxID=392033 RepID=A0A813QV52_9BILA|nr:unnamed protein product [Rotaria sordida]CAF0772128.1 unnamed protein product [Rotaria sordida]CAF0799246.1 unnamed protein product [Rotaria sordida]CAF0847680.1 unnamed protein product [Rotaria sordida]CAF0884536.1 unnamed protein product [Rotaria sordida]
MSSIISDVELKSHIDQTIIDNDITDEITPTKKLRFRTYKNLIVLCVAFLLQFTAFSAIGNLQSSLNTEANVGVNSLSIIYAFLIFSAIFLPHPLIALLGLKWTLVLCQIPYLLYVAANYYPKAYLMYPAAALVGLGAAPLWTSKCSYLTDTGAIYAERKHIHKDVVVNRFFGIFFMFFQSSQVWGNLISYLVLKPIEKQSNETLYNQIEKYNKCGVDFSEKEYKGTEVVNQIDRKTVNILCIVYICICICSILTVIIFLNQRRKSSRDEISVMLRNSVKLLISTVKHLRNVNQLLLIPLTVWSGLEQSFLGAQFTKGFVSCTLNAKYVGLVLIAYGICDSIGSFSFGQLVKYVGRWPCFVIAALINYSLIITMFIWKPSDDQIVVLFVLAGLWGLADAVWQTQINAFYGVLFVNNDEAAFSNYRLWESGGFVLFYIITPYIRIRIALIILLIFLSLGMIGYGLTEYLWKIKTKKKVQAISS